MEYLRFRNVYSEPEPYKGMALLRAKGLPGSAQAAGLQTQARLNVEHGELDTICVCIPYSPVDSRIFRENPCPTRVLEAFFIKGCESVFFT